MKKSLTSLFTESNTVKNLRNEYKPMYHELGVGRIVGYLIFVMYFTVLPYWLRMIWGRLMEYDVVVVYVGSVFVINVGVFVVYNLVLYCIYTLKHPFFQQYKNTPKPWPWQQNPSEWQKLKLKSFKFIFINFFIITPIMVYISIQTSLPFDFSVEDWPTTWELVWQFGVFVVVEDGLFYLAHWVLHRPKLYWIHKYHHQYRQTISLAAHYVHPIQYVLAGTLPSSLGFQLLSYVTRVHYSTVLVWLTYRIIQSYQGHCGYTWTWNTLSLFPYTVGSDYHDFHHAMNSGNYGSIFIFWDALFNTETSFIKYLEKEVQEKGRKQVQ